MQICLDSREISVSKEIWLKNQSSPFSKQFMGFFNLLKCITIKLYKFPKYMIIFILIHFKLERWQAEPSAQSLKNPKFQNALFRTKFQGNVVYVY